MKMSAVTAPVGFIGLGIMGEGMVGRLITEKVVGTSDSNPLVIWNRTGSKCSAFQSKHPDANIIIKSSAKEVVESCGVTYCMLSTPEASREVFEDAENGVLAGVSEGKSIVDCATLAESDMTRMSKEVISKGGRFLEAPVSGSKGPAATGSLIFLCAGSKDLFDEVLPNGLAAMGKASHFLGEIGRGTRAKLVVNSLMGTMMAAYSEGLALSESVGLDPSKIIEVIGQGAIASPIYAMKGPKMVAKDHAPNFPLKHAHKDMKLASDMAKEAGVSYSVNDQAELVFRKAREDADLNVADADFSAVFEQIYKDSTSTFAKER